MVAHTALEVMTMLYTITATRSDNTECVASVEAADQVSAMRECKRTFRTFVVKSAGITLCGVHSATRQHVCHFHRGETMSFRNHQVREGL